MKTNSTQKSKQAPTPSRQRSNSEVVAQGRTNGPQANGKGNIPTSTQVKSTGTRAGQSGPQKRPVKRRSRFRIRPLDVGLLGLGLLVVGVIAWSVVTGANTAPPVGTLTNTVAPGVGQPAPDFSLPGTDDKTHSLSALKGKVVFLEFMAPWCPHCQGDAPVFNQVFDAYKDKNVQMLGVSATPYGRNHEPADGGPPDNTPNISMDDMKWFRDTFSVKYPLLYDRTLGAGNNYGIQNYPTIFIVGKDGNIAAVPQYPFTLDSLKAAIDKALQ